MEHTKQPAEPAKRRVADLGALNALAHPIRFEIFEALSQYGAATASMLAERLGESSGSTSYHLRSLAKHDLVREVEGRGTARERWWERIPGSIVLNARSEDDPVVRAATDLVADRWNVSRAEQLAAFIARGDDEADQGWAQVSTLITTNLHLTKEQLAEIVTSFEAWHDEFVTPYRGRTDPGSRPVQLHFNAFPLLEQGAQE